MPGIDFRAVRALVSMREVLELLHWTGSASGSQLRGHCPLHGSESRTSRVFSVNLVKNIFQCFKCGAAGNALDLWAKATSRPLFEAAQDLCTRLNRPVPWIGGSEKRNA